MNRNLVIIGVVVVLVAGFLVVNQATDRDGDSVAIIGDSITVLDSGQMQKQLSSEFKVTLRATLGIRLSESMTTAQQLAAAKPTQVIIDLGSNDALKATPVDQAIKDLQSMVALFKTSECIHLVDLNTHMVALGVGPVAPEAKAINQAIADLAAKDDRIDVISWDKIVSDDIAAHPPKGTLTADTVHPGAKGQLLLAEEADTVLHRCGRPWQFW